ncbi:hypothetical protein [Pyrobaculum neutrophilum]|uniref:Uncharacterized protein n=1 Tax=Pyrobaculum neutrophilum (strain DSM 2338 / JCM 9278 / NBRC 100436 / V24Sta) TaxID=444157 RepID=B1YCV2_PYRNV|nr:hypothetical protein [Pyrobaculum neutrophilum]ACB39615.1 hypothetical protein Tneu_0676 [Pyrobaculum neutrophilum V24Sta]
MKTVEESLYNAVVSAVVTALLLALASLFPLGDLAAVLKAAFIDIEHMRTFISTL